MKQTKFNEELNHAIFETQISQGNCNKLHNACNCILKLLSTEKAEKFKEEHLSRYDKEAKMPPDVIELNEILKDGHTWFKDLYKNTPFWIIQSLALAISVELDQWIKMIKQYYPKNDIHVTTEHAIEIAQEHLKETGAQLIEGLAAHRKARREDTRNVFSKCGNKLQEPRQAQPDEDYSEDKDLRYYCQKAIEKGILVKTKTGYKRNNITKALLAYFLDHFRNSDGTFPDNKYCEMFGETRLSKACTQLIDNKNGGGKPRGYETIDALLKE